MLRYISEHKITPAGTSLAVPKGSLFKSVTKVLNYFVLSIEVFANEADLIDVEVVVKKKEIYIHPKAKFIDSVLVGTELFHFYYQPLGIDSENDAESTVIQEDPKQPPKREEDL